MSRQEPPSQHPSAIDPARAAAILAAFGAKPGRWPAAERDALRAAVAEEPLSAALAEEATLDAQLDAFRAETFVAASSALAARVLAEAPRSPRAAPLPWPRAAMALAASAVLGVVVGFSGAPIAAGPAPLQDPAAMDSVIAAALGEAPPPWFDEANDG